MRSLFYTLCYLSMSFIAYSQSINVHKTDGSTHSFRLYKINSITYSTGGGSPCPGIPTVTFGENVYNTVLLGQQCWLRENIDLGIMIQGSENQANNGIIEKYCYNNDPVYCNIYGGLYQWDEVMQYVTNEGAQGICPDGWHIPTQSQLITLALNYEANALKEIGQGTGEGTGTNTSGFSALLAGYRSVSGNISSLGGVGYFWTSANYTTRAVEYALWGGQNSLTYGSLDKSYGMSIRCLKN